MIIQKPTGALPTFTVEFGAPPTGAQAAVLGAPQERARHNSRYLQTHWHELLPQALGKFVAVAGEEAFVVVGHFATQLGSYSEGLFQTSHAGSLSMTIAVLLRNSKIKASERYVKVQSILQMPSMKSCPKPPSFM